MPDTQAIQAHWKTTLVILTLSAVLMSLSYTMLIPFLPMYLIEELGVEQSRANFWSGLVFSVSFLISGVMAPIWGAMADKRSRKLMALRAAILLAVSYALGGIVQNEWQLLAMRCFQGFASGLWPACLAIMASTVPRERIGLAMGIMQGGMTAGGVLGPFFGGALAELFSMRMTFFIGGAALAVITLLILFFIHEPPRKEQKKAAAAREKTSLLKIPVVQRMLLCAGVVQLTILLQQPVMPMYIGELQGSMDRIVFVTGIVFSVVGVSGVIASPLWGVIGQKWGYRPALYTALAGTACFGMIQAIPDTLVPFAVRGPRPHLRPLLRGTAGRQRDRPARGRRHGHVPAAQVRHLPRRFHSPAACHLPLVHASEERGELARQSRPAALVPQGIAFGSNSKLVRAASPRGAVILSVFSRRVPKYGLRFDTIEPLILIANCQELSRREVVSLGASALAGPFGQIQIEWIHSYLLRWRFWARLPSSTSSSASPMTPSTSSIPPSAPARHPSG